MRNALVVFLFLILSINFIYADNENKKVNIPELMEMHQYIHPMWHKGYPDKDYELLKSLYPDLLNQFKELEAAEFPMEWPDRQLHWRQALDKMESALQDYKKAIDENNNEFLLTAAEEVHSAFEGLMRIVNPPIPEVDAFHRVLYHVYHDYLPNKNWKAIDNSITQFQEKFMALQATELPKWMSDKNKEFKEAREELGKSVEMLAALKNSNDQKKIEAVIEQLHDAYVKLISTYEK